MARLAPDSFLSLPVPHFSPPGPPPSVLWENPNLPPFLKCKPDARQCKHRDQGLPPQASGGRLGPADWHAGQPHGGCGTRTGGSLGSQARLPGDQGIAWRLRDTVAK